jgi:hypothetical protein
MKSDRGLWIYVVSYGRLFIGFYDIFSWLGLTGTSDWRVGFDMDKSNRDLFWYVLCLSTHGKTEESASEFMDDFSPKFKLKTFEQYIQVTYGVHIATQVYGLMQKSVMCYLQTVLRL